MKKMNNRYLHILLLVLLVLSCSSLLALQVRPKLIINQIDTSDFPATKSFITVLDSKGNSIKGLLSENFAIREDGKSVTAFKANSIFPDREWLSLVLAIDISGSMKGEPLAKAKEAATDFVSRVGLHDQMSLVTFHDIVAQEIDFTVERELLLRKISTIQTLRDTALYDAVLFSLNLLEKTTSPRKALVILTDGRDTRSKTKWQQCSEFIRQKGIPIYTVGLGEKINQDILSSIAKEGGGSFFHAPAPADLINIYQKIAEQLENQYILTYNSKIDPTEVTHRLEVSVNYKGTSFADYKYYSSPFDLSLEETITEFKTRWLTFWEESANSLLIGAIIGLVVFAGLSILLRYKRKIGLIQAILFIILGIILSSLIGSLVKLII